MASRTGHYVFLALLATVVLGANLGGAKLWDRDEPRNAGCAGEMLARGDWVVPVFDAELRTHKPVMLYWLIMASYSVLGVNEWSARLPSALLSVGTVLCTYEMGRRLHNARGAVWGGGILATSLLFVMAGRAATPDAALIFFSTLSLTLFVTGVFPDRASAWGRERLSGEVLGPGCPSRLMGFPTGWVRPAAIYGSMGLAVLAKGPVGCVLPTAVIGLFLLMVRRPTGEPGADPRGWSGVVRAVGRVVAPRHVLRTAWEMRPLTAITVVLLVAAPWYVWVGYRTDGEFLRGFFLEHNFGRAMQTMEGHRGNILFYPLAILVGTFPWSVFAAPLLLDLWRQRGHRGPGQMGITFSAAWVAVYLGVFTCARTKLPSYVTPCYPAIALLAGAFVDRWLAGECLSARAWRVAACGVLSLVGMVITVGAAVAAQRLLPGEEWLGAIGLVPLLGGLGCICLLSRGQDARGVKLFGLTATGFLVLLFGVGTSRVARHQRYDQLWSAIRATGAQHPSIAAFACLEPSWVFYGGWPIEELSRGDTGPTHSPWIEDRGRWVPKPRCGIDDFLKRPGTPFLLVRERDLATLQPQLPSDFRILETVPFFLKKDRLVLLGPSQSSPIARRTDADTRH